MCAFKDREKRATMVHLNRLFDVVSCREGSSKRVHELHCLVAELVCLARQEPWMTDDVSTLEAERERIVTALLACCPDVAGMLDALLAYPEVRDWIEHPEIDDDVWSDADAELDDDDAASAAVDTAGVEGAAAATEEEEDGDCDCDCACPSAAFFNSVAIVNLAVAMYTVYMIGVKL